MFLPTTPASQGIRRRRRCARDRGRPTNSIQPRSWRQQPPSRRPMAAARGARLGSILGLRKRRFAAAPSPPTERLGALVGGFLPKMNSHLAVTTRKGGSYLSQRDLRFRVPGRNFAKGGASNTRRAAEHSL